MAEQCSAVFNPTLNISRKMPPVAFLQVGALPVLAGDHAAAQWTAAMALKPIVIAGIGGGVVKADLLTHLDDPPRQQADLPGDPGVGVAGMIDIIAGVAIANRPQIHALVHLQAVAIIAILQSGNLVGRAQFAAPHHQQLALVHRLDGEQAKTALLGHRAHFQLWADIGIHGQRRHVSPHRSRLRKTSRLTAGQSRGLASEVMTRRGPAHVAGF